MPVLEVKVRPLELWKNRDEFMGLSPAVDKANGTHANKSLACHLHIPFLSGAPKLTKIDHVVAADKQWQVEA